MENNDKISKYRTDAVEHDWLEITYTQRNYLDEEKVEVYRPVTKKQPLFYSTAFKLTAVLIIIVALVVAMIFVNGNSNIFETAKAAYTSTVLKNIVGNSKKVTVNLPVNATVSNIASDGTVSLTGGSICLNLAKGKVKSVTEKSVTIEIDQDIYYVYSSLTEVMVKEGDTVELYDVLGKYQGTLNINVVINNTVVTNITGTSTSFEWSN